MAEIPVIDISSELRWYRRFSTAGLTLGLWSAWALLWRPLFASMHHAADARSLWPAAWVGQGGGIAGHALSSATVTLLGTSGVMFFWQLLAPRGRNRGPATTASGGCEEAPTMAVEVARRSRVVVVTHAEDGSIEAIFPAVEGV